jgi:hypothetical protein
MNLSEIEEQRGKMIKNLADIGLNEGEHASDQMQTPRDENVRRFVDLLNPVDERRDTVENVRFLQKFRGFCALCDILGGNCKTTQGHP